MNKKCTLMNNYVKKLVGVASEESIHWDWAVVCYDKCVREIGEDEMFDAIEASEMVECLQKIMRFYAKRRREIFNPYTRLFNHIILLDN